MKASLLIQQASAIRFAKVSPGPVLSQTNRAEITLRRFWKTVNIKQEQDGYRVLLDHRLLKTPAGSQLVVTKRLVATLIANEWENQDEVLKQHALPMTSLASRALDGLRDEKIRRGVEDALIGYLETDTICYPDDTPVALVRLQEQHWKPLYQWLKQDYDIELQVAGGFSPARQTKDTVEKMRGLLREMNMWELAAFERAAYASKSFVIALGLCKGRLTANQAADASHVEVRSQIERWGEVEDTHDVDHAEIRKALGSAVCLLAC